jgi:hypothetical protein
MVCLTPSPELAENNAFSSGVSSSSEVKSQEEKEKVKTNSFVSLNFYLLTFTF